jgi:hypothetical protein
MPSIEGPFTMWFTEWIDKESLWLLRQETTNNDPYGSGPGPTVLLLDFNDPSAPPRYPVAVPAAEPRRVIDTLVVAASEDASIREVAQDANLEGDDTLHVDGAPQGRTLIRFEVAGLPSDAEVLSATLGLFVSEGDSLRFDSAPMARAGTVYRVDGNWEAATVTWKNAPAMGGRLGELVSAEGFPRLTPTDLTRSWVRTDVTPVVTGDGSFDFYVTNDTSLAGTSFVASEAPNGPVLVITYEYPESAPIPFGTSSP